MGFSDLFNKNMIVIPTTINRNNIYSIATCIVPMCIDNVFGFNVSIYGLAGNNTWPMPSIIKHNKTTPAALRYLEKVLSIAYSQFIAFHLKGRGTHLLYQE
jgi:hypothetical protein